jgi:hypothetical protein
MKSKHLILSGTLLITLIAFVHALVAADVRCYDTVKTMTDETQPGNDSCPSPGNSCTDGKACSYYTYNAGCKKCVTSKTETHQKLQSSSNSGVVATLHTAPCVNDGFGCGDCDWAHADPDAPSSTYCQECVFTTSGCL